MSEIEKMYKLANIKAKEYCDRDSDACINCCPEWENRQNCWKYKSAMPPFTTEKQIEILKLLCQQRFIELGTTPDDEYFLYDHDCCQSHSQHFNEAVAKFVNMLWQNLTEEEKQQIKEILNEKL